MDLVHYATEPYEGEQDFSPGWFFWDETLAGRFGPYETEQEAREKLKQYCEEVLEGGAR